jgi:hypothetical protein
MARRHCQEGIVTLGAALMLDGTKYTIRQFVTAVKGLSKATPHSDALDQPTTHDGFKEQWIGWLEEYLTPGYYDRQNFVDDVETAYKRLNNGRMIVWLNEAAGEDPRIVRAAIVAIDERYPPQTEAKFARRVLP